MNKKWLLWAGLTIGGIFALIGVAFTAVFIAMQFGWLNVRGSIAARNAFFFGSTTPQTAQVFVAPCVAENQSSCNWNETPEWAVVAGGLAKDAPVIQKVSSETNVSPRLIASVVVPEQIRFFTSDREVFKRYFEPLKILGSLSQFSLGVSGIKEQTAQSIEAYANDPQSPFYPGAGYAELLAYDPATTTPHDAQLYNRLTDAKNHYYSYLYTAVYLKEVEMQWQRAGFPIADKPAIVGTLFNIGFEGSHPNANPQTAGSIITTGGKQYAFGELGGDFFDSLELRTVFPL